MPDRTYEAARKDIESWYLGRTSTVYETSGRGVGTVSTGSGDHGGASYGAYQLSSRAGTLTAYLNESAYGHRFNGQVPGSAEFNATWRALAREPGFAEEQHDFIARTHYDVQLRALKRAGIDLEDRGRAVHDALWSTSVQFGPRAKTVFIKGLQEKFGATFELSVLSDVDIVSAVQDYKINQNQTLFKSSPNNWPGLLRRAAEEKQDLIELSRHEKLLAERNELPNWRKSTEGNPARRDQGAEPQAPRSFPPRLRDDGDDGRLRVTPGTTLTLADDPSHRDFATFNRIQTWVSGTGQWDERESRNVAAALYREQAGNPLVRSVDYVAGGRGRDGAENVFAVYAPFGEKEPRFTAVVDGREARRQPAEQSLQQADRLVQIQLQKEQEQVLHNERQQGMPR